jgi:hypothetical protein
MKLKTINRKGAAPIISGILVLLMSIIFLGIIIGFTIPYFNTLTDLQKFNNNKKNISMINNIFSELRTADDGSYISFYIDPSDDIIFNDENNTITIKQDIKNYNYFEKRKDDLDYGNLNISKEKTLFVLTLDVNDIADINNSITLSKNKQEIKFEVLSISTDDKPVVKVTRVN